MTDYNIYMNVYINVIKAIRLFDFIWFIFTIKQKEDGKSAKFR